MKRNTLILLLVGLAFGAYLYFVEAEREVADESDEPALRYVVDFPVDEALSARIAVGEGPPAHIEKGESGWVAWDEQNPRRYEADEDWIEDFLELVRGIQGTGLVEEGAVNLSDYGIRDDGPSIEVHGKDAAGTQWTRRVVIGDKTPVGEKLYVTNQDGNAVFLMDGYLRGQLDRGVANFRPRRLLNFETEQVARIEIAHHAGEPFVLNRVEGSWKVSGDTQAPLDNTKVDAMLGDLKFLVVSEFTFDKLADRAPEYGLASPTQSIILKNAEGAVLANLQVGDRVEAASGDYYVATGNSDEVFTVKPAAIGELPKTLEDLAPAPPKPSMPEGSSEGQSPADVPADLPGESEDLSDDSPVMDDTNHGGIPN